MKTAKDVLKAISQIPDAGQESAMPGGGMGM